MTFLACALLAACGGTPRSPESTTQRSTAAAVPKPTPGKLTTDPDLNRAPPTPLLSIRWSEVPLASDADALALWRQIAPTGADWEAKVDEIPDDDRITTALAGSILRGGNLTCASSAPHPTCARLAASDLEPPAADATFDDPCLRRMLALWAIASLDEAQVPAMYDALKAIVAIPPPESQLVAAVLDATNALDPDRRLELRAIAFAAGHRELVNTSSRLGDFDDAHQVAALTRHHIDGVLDVLPAESHRSAFLTAIGDEVLPSSRRVSAITELVSTLDVGPLPKDLRTTLIAATRADDCEVAAAAARVLVTRGEKKYAPVRPRRAKPPAMMRALCVLASYEAQQSADEPSYLLGYVPTRGLERVRRSWDPSETDVDGDGDPNTTTEISLVARDEVVLPEIESMIAAFHHCTGQVCTSDIHDFRFAFKPGPGGDLQLVRLEIDDRPPCR